jgi:hypothetical protein
MKRKLFLALVFGLLVNQNLLADSPLTSTQISNAYKDYAIIQLASKSNGDISVDLMNYLYEKSNPIDVKIALINEIANSGWRIDFKEKNNAAIFLEYLQQKDSGFSLNGNPNSETLISYAYLKALDNYFDVAEATKWADLAKYRNEESYTVNIVWALIHAQQAMDSDWCKVYKLTNSVRENKGLEKDMQEEALSIIFDYMDIYKDYCN